MSQRIIDRSYVGEVLHRIYSSDLHARLTLHWQEGYFYFNQGDTKQPLQGTTIEEVVSDLASRLASDFPQSDFAYWWKMNFSAEKE
jgi:hypothetical protein